MRGWHHQLAHLNIHKDWSRNVFRKNVKFQKCHIFLISHPIFIIFSLLCRIFFFIFFFIDSILEWISPLIICALSPSKFKFGVTGSLQDCLTVAGNNLTSRLTRIRGKATNQTTSLCFHNFHCVYHSRIKEIPTQLFVHLTDLIFIDFSDNMLGEFPSNYY